MHCNLCGLKRRGQWFEDDAMCTVCVPLEAGTGAGGAPPFSIMVVPKTHASAIHGALYNHCLAQITKYADMLCGHKTGLRGYKLEAKANRAGHWHMKARFHR